MPEIAESADAEQATSTAPPEAPKLPHLSHTRDSRTGMARIAISHAGRAGKVFVVGPGAVSLLPTDEDEALQTMLSLPAKGGKDVVEYLHNVFTGAMSETQLKGFLVKVRESFKTSRNLISSGRYEKALKAQEDAAREARGQAPRKTRTRYIQRETELL